MRYLRWPLLMVCLTALIVAVSVTVYAQPGDPGNPDTPITGIEILMGLGSLLGVRKILQSRRNKQN